MNSTSIRSAYASGTGTSSGTSSADSSATCPTCGAPTTASLATDAMIEKAKAMRPKPFTRQIPLPDAPPRIQTDATRVTPKKRY